jgi:hypothetical protein
VARRTTAAASRRLADRLGWIAAICAMVAPRSSSRRRMPRALRLVETGGCSSSRSRSRQPVDELVRRASRFSARSFGVTTTSMSAGDETTISGFFSRSWIVPFRAPGGRRIRV